MSVWLENGITRCRYETDSVDRTFVCWQMMTPHCSSLIPLWNYPGCRTVMKPYRHRVFTWRQERFCFRFIPTSFPFSFHTVFKQVPCRHRVNGKIIHNGFVPFSNHTCIVWTGPQLTFAVTPRYDWSKTSEVWSFNIFSAYIPSYNEDYKCLSCSGIPHLRKWILRKWDTAFLKKVSSYKKVFSLKKYHFLTYNFLVYGPLHYEPWAGLVHVCTRWLLGDGDQGNFQDKKGAILAIAELILKINSQEHLYLHLES